MKAVHIQVRGVVQGVGYRAFVEREAVALGLSGWVRNRRDGSVEAVAAGEAEAVDTLIARCHAGPRMARVEAVDVEPCAEPPAGRFSWRRAYERGGSASKAHTLVPLSFDGSGPPLIETRLAPSSRV